MRFYIDLDSQQLVQSPARLSPVGQATVKGGGGIPLEVQFLKGGNPFRYPVGVEAHLEYEVKPAGVYEGSALVHVVGFTRPDAADGFYTALADFSLDALTTLFHRADGNLANDVPSIPAIYEFAWAAAPGEVPTRTLNTPSLQILNWVITGDEAPPSGEVGKVIYWLSGVTALLGNANSLASLATAAAARPEGQMVALVIAGTEYHYRLESGTDTQSLPDVVLPLDYAVPANEKVWRKISVFVPPLSVVSASCRFTADHTGWKPGNFVRDLGAGSQQVASFTINYDNPAAWPFAAHVAPGPDLLSGQTVHIVASLHNGITGEDSPIDLTLDGPMAAADIGAAIASAMAATDWVVNSGITSVSADGTGAITIFAGAPGDAVTYSGWGILVFDNAGQNYGGPDNNFNGTIYDTDGNGGGAYAIAIDDFTGTTGSQPEVTGTDLAAMVAADISANCPFATASASGNVVTVIWNSPGAVSNLGSIDTVITEGAPADSVVHAFLIKDAANLNTDAGYSLLL